MRRKCTYGISHPHSFVVIGRAETDCLEKLWSATSVFLESFIHPKGSRRDCCKFLSMATEPLAVGLAQSVIDCVA